MRCACGQPAVIHTADIATLPDGTKRKTEAHYCGRCLPPGDLRTELERTNPGILRPYRTGMSARAWKFAGILPDVEDHDAALSACDAHMPQLLPGGAHANPVNAFRAGFMRGLAWGLAKAGAPRQEPPPRPAQPTPEAPRPTPPTEF